MRAASETRSADYRFGAGIACALGTGLLWGLVFVAPVLLADYPALVLSVGRYLAFGLIALPLAWLDRTRITSLTRADWIEAGKLSLIGNLVYYAFLAAAIQAAGAPVPTMIIGTLPVVIAITANLHSPQLRWSRLMLPLALIALGIGLVNRDEWQTMQAMDASRRASFLIGALLAIGAVACWTWYPIRNARWLQQRQSLGSDTWATAQGLMTLPLAILCSGLLWLLDGPLAAVGHSPLAGFDGVLGPRPAQFIIMMLVVGLLASWLGTLLWNRSSKLLPTALAGQLIVFETLAALAYAFALRQQWPAPSTWAGVSLLLAGVIVAARRFEAAR